MDSPAGCSREPGPGALVLLPGAPNLLCGTLNLLPGAFILSSGAFVLPRGMLILPRGAFIPYRGAFILSPGMLILLWGTLILSRGTFRRSGRQTSPALFSVSFARGDVMATLSFGITAPGCIFEDLPLRVNAYYKILAREFWISGLTEKWFPITILLASPLGCSAPGVLPRL